MAALIGGAMALGGAIYGGIQANKAANAARQNNAMSQDNYLWQRLMAEKQAQLATAGTQDARGNRTEYIPGLGWVERPTNQTRDILGASDREEQARLAQDMPRSRMRRENTFQRQQTEGGLADGMMARARMTERTPEQVNAAAIRTGIAEAAAAPNALRRNISTMALRQGTGGETAIAELGRQNMADRRSVIARADADTPRMFANEDDARLNGPTNRYGVLAGRATAGDDIPFVPSTLADTMTASRMRQMGVAPQGIGAAMSIRPPTMQVVDDRLGQRIAAVGAGIEGFGDAYGGDMNSLYKRLFASANANQRTVPDTSAYAGVPQQAGYGTRF